MTKPELDALRREIDDIDARLHDLIMRRAEIVREVAAAKAGGAGPVFRPVREAAVLRRLIERHAGDFPVAALVRTWREIIAASVAMQAEVTVAAPQALRETARAHFGSVLGITTAADAAGAVAAVRDGNATFAVVPPEGPWTEVFASWDAVPLQIALTLPAIRAEQRPEALVVGRAGTFANEGADASAMLVIYTERVEDAALAEAQRAAGLPDAVRYAAPRADGGQLTLFLFDDYVAPDSAAMGAFLTTDALPVLDGYPAGAFPKPILLNGS